MSKNSETREFEIPKSTLAAAQILNLDPQTLMGLYDDDFFYEIEDNQVLMAQIDEIHLNLGIFLNTGEEEIKEKITKAMEIDPFFKQFVFDFLLMECANQLVAGVSSLHEETFNRAIKLIEDDEELKKRLSETIEMTQAYQEESENAVEQEILHIKLNLERILQNDMDETILEPTSYPRNLHRIIIKINNGTSPNELTEKERRMYKDHVENNGSCPFCAIIETRGFSSFEEFSGFIIDAREFKTIMDKSREIPQPGKNPSKLIN